MKFDTEAEAIRLANQTRAGLASYVFFYWRTVCWFAAGFAANAAYGVLQLMATLGGRNLDALVLNPITGGAASINIWGAVSAVERLPRERADR